MSAHANRVKRSPFLFCCRSPFAATYCARSYIRTVFAAPRTVVYLNSLVRSHSFEADSFSVCPPFQASQEDYDSRIGMHDRASFRYADYASGDWNNPKQLGSFANFRLALSVLLFGGFDREKFLSRWLQLKLHGSIQLVPSMHLAVYLDFRMTRGISPRFADSRKY